MGKKKRDELPFQHLKAAFVTFHKNIAKDHSPPSFCPSQKLATQAFEICKEQYLAYIFQFIVRAWLTSALGWP